MAKEDGEQSEGIPTHNVAWCHPADVDSEPLLRWSDVGGM